MAGVFGNLLKKFYNPNLTQIRGLIKNKISAGGIQYFGFKYHPRHPDFKDPPYEPTKLFFITRIKSVVGTNPIERNALQILNIDGHKKNNGHKAVVKNIPEVNKYLWKIKHMISIVPITCPQGMPPDQELGTTHLHDNGVLEIRNRINASATKERALLTDQFRKSEKRMDSVLLKKTMRTRWMKPWQGTINDTDTQTWRDELGKGPFSHW